MRVSVGRRLLLVAIVALVVAAPAIVLRAFCVGRSCERPTTAAASVPFCSLPSRVRADIVDGYREQRAPDVLAVTGRARVAGGTGVTLDGLRPAWPSVREDDADRVPLAFFGTGVDEDATIPPGTTLDDVAPTIADIMGIERPHPNVRSGEAIAGVANGERPRLVLLVILKGIGSADVADRKFFDADVATLAARVGSAPLDPAATMTTIGTGGLPSQHGITGTLLRNEEGSLVRAWSADAPPSVIAALGDDLDRQTADRARVGIVATDVSDRGAIGRNWYLDADRDDVVVGDGRATRQVGLALRVAARGYGGDGVPDLLALVVQDRVGRTQRSVLSLLESLLAHANGSVATVVTATGAQADEGAVPAALVQSDAEFAIPGQESLIEATAVGGAFLDQEALVRGGLSADAAVQALRAARTPGGAPLFADVFPGRAVTFARYC